MKNQYYSYRNKFCIPLLRRIIQDKSGFKYSDVGYYKKEIFFPKYKLNDKILSELIDNKLKINEYMGNRNEYGYFCYCFKNSEIEALYSTINSAYLYNYSEIKDLIDDYEKPDEFIEKLYIKSRAMSLEYYINITIFIEKYKVIPFPRIIFPLDELKTLKKDLKNEVEIDGSYLINEHLQLIIFIDLFCSSILCHTQVQIKCLVYAVKIML